MSPPEVLVHHDAGLLAKAAAARLVTRLVDAQAAAGTASLVLTGGGIGTAVLTELDAAPAEVKRNGGSSRKRVTASADAPRKEAEASRKDRAR